MKTAFSIHSCNAYCKPPIHAGLAWSNGPIKAENIVAAYENSNVQREFISIRPAPEAPSVVPDGPWAGEVTEYKYLIFWRNLNEQPASPNP